MRSSIQREVNKWYMWKGVSEFRNNNENAYKSIIVAVQ